MSCQQVHCVAVGKVGRHSFADLAHKVDRGKRGDAHKMNLQPMCPTVPLEKAGKW